VAAVSSAKIVRKRDTSGKLSPQLIGPWSRTGVHFYWHGRLIGGLCRWVYQRERATDPTPGSDESFTVHRYAKRRYRASATRNGPSNNKVCHRRPPITCYHDLTSFLADAQYLQDDTKFIFNNCILSQGKSGPPVGRY